MVVQFGEALGEVHPKASPGVQVFGKPEAGAQGFFQVGFQRGPGRPLGQHAAPRVQEHHPVHQGQAGVHLVLDEQHGVTSFKAGQGLEELPGARRVQIGRWFIQDEDGLLHGQQCGQGYSLGLASRQGIQPPVTVGKHPHLFQSLEDAVFHVVARDPQVLQAKSHLVLHHQGGEGGFGVLQHQTNMRGHVSGRLPAGVQPSHPNLAFHPGIQVVGYQAGEGVGQAGFAATRRAQEEHGLPLGHLQGQARGGSMGRARISNDQVAHGNHEGALPSRARSCGTRASRFCGVSTTTSTSCRALRARMMGWGFKAIVARTSQGPSIRAMRAF